VVAGPERGDRLEHLGRASAAFPVRNPQRLELGLVPADPDAEDGAPGGQDVKGRPLLRQRDGITKRQDHHERPEVHRARDAREGGEERDRFEPGDPVRGRRHEQVVNQHPRLETEVFRAAQVPAHLRERRSLVAKRVAGQPQAVLHGRDLPLMRLRIEFLHLGPSRCLADITPSTASPTRCMSSITVAPEERLMRAPHRLAPLRLKSIPQRISDIN
jgi:hypothetical protein